MKLGADNPKKTGIAIALGVASVLLFIYEMSPSAAPTGQSATPAADAVKLDVKLPPLKRNKKQAPAKILDDTPDPRLREDLLRASELTSYDGSGRNIFRAETEVEIPQPKAPVVIVKQGPVLPPPPPPPPPINLRFFGFATKPGGPKKVFLAQGDGPASEVFVAAEGEIVNRRYKVLHIGVNSVEIQDVLNNNVQTIPLSQG